MVWDKVFAKRAMTAVLGILLILSLMFWGGIWGMTLLAILACFGALFEYFAMLFSLREQKLQQIVGIAAGFFLSFLIIFRSSFLYEGMSLFFVFMFIFYLLLFHLYEGSYQKLFYDLGSSLLGVFYIAVLFSFWPKIRELPNGLHWIFLVFLIPWLSDTFAYFVGRSFGKRKLAPAISPHKTQEGAIAGIIAAVLGVCFFKVLSFEALGWGDCLIVGSVGAVVSQVGDLFESFIKRALGVKDSGVVIPGHGGILDRFDSVLFCGPFIYFYAGL